jgi:hypothetical protein
MIMPRELNTMVDGSGTGGTFESGIAVKVPDCELKMLLPDVKSAAMQVPLGQKYNWIFAGVGAIPFGRVEVKNSEKPPVYSVPAARPPTPVSLASPWTLRPKKVSPLA